MGISKKEIKENRVVVGIISGLLAILGTFMVMYFAALSQDDPYTEDRQFIRTQIERQGRQVEELQESSRDTAIAVAEINLTLEQLQEQLDRIEAGQRGECEER